MNPVQYFLAMAAFDPHSLRLWPQFGALGIALDRRSVDFGDTQADNCMTLGLTCGRT